MLRESEVAFLLPGILSRGESFQALGSLTGEAITYDTYGSWRFEVDGVIEQVASDIRRYLRLGNKALLVGASLGGMLTPFVVREIRKWLKPDEDVLLSNLRIVIIDAPSGAKTMKAVSPLAARILTSPFGHLLRPLAHVKVLPKDKYIEVPDAATMHQIADDVKLPADWRTYIKERAKRELGGHSGKLWLGELRWMIQVGADGSLAEACASLADLDVAYLACMGDGNDVVAQPLACEHWAAATPGLRVLSIEATHCGFVQQAVTFRGALAKILG